MITRDDCIHNISDEDCIRCTKHRRSCDGCADYEIIPEARKEFEREQREMHEEEVIKAAETLKNYCKEHYIDNVMRACKCPYSRAFNNGYLCGLTGFPKDFEEGEKNND